MLNAFILVLQFMGHNPTTKEVQEMLKVVDLDNTGEIEFAEFLSLMQNMKDFYHIGRT